MSRRVPFSEGPGSLYTKSVANAKTTEPGGDAIVPLTEERRRRGWSLAELARRAGMHPSTVGLIESGRLQAYPGQLAKLADALGVPTSTLAADQSAASRGTVSR